MPAPVFRMLPNIFLNVLGESSKAVWSRLVDDPDNPGDFISEESEIKVIFNRAHADRDVAGIEIEDAEPTAFVSQETAMSIAPERDEELIFDNQDTLEISGITYRVVSSKPDGYGMVRVRLRR